MLDQLSTGPCCELTRNFVPCNPNEQAVHAKRGARFPCWAVDGIQGGWLSRNGFQSCWRNGWLGLWPKDFRFKYKMFMHLPSKAQSMQLGRVVNCQNRNS